MLDFEFVTRHMVRDTPAYQCELDVYERASGDTFLLAHIVMLRWTPSAFKQLMREWKLFRQCVRAPIFACPKEHDARWVKFVTALGFEYLTETICNNGAQRPLYIHVIKDNVVRDQNQSTIGTAD